MIGYLKKSLTLNYLRNKLTIAVNSKVMDRYNSGPVVIMLHWYGSEIFERKKFGIAEILEFKN